MLEGGFWFAFGISSLRDEAEWVVLCAQCFSGGRFHGVVACESSKQVFHFILNADDDINLRRQF